MPNLPPQKMSHDPFSHGFNVCAVPEVWRPTHRNKYRKYSHKVKTNIESKLTRMGIFKNFFP